MLSQDSRSESGARVVTIVLQAAFDHDFSDKHSVLSPSDPIAIEKDVKRKLKLYGIVQALRRGRLPDNRQLDSILVHVRDSLSAEAPAHGQQVLQKEVTQDKTTIATLSDDGRAVVLDVRDILQTIRQLLQQKNAGDVLQDLIHHTSGINASTSPPGVELSVSVEEARKDGHTAVQHIGTLSRLLLTNREARKLLKDSKLILRDLFAQTAVAAAERARPSASEMDGLDDATPAQDWPAGSFGDREDDEPVTHAIDGTENTHDVGGHPRAQDRCGKGDIHEKKEDREPTEENSEAVNHSNFSADNQKGSLNLNLKDHFHNLFSRVPQHYLTRAKQEYTSVRAYLEDEFPEERRDQFLWRLKKVVDECQATDSYQASISWFLTVIHTYFSNARVLVTSHASQTNDLFAEDPLLACALSELRTIAERGAGGKNLDSLLDAIDVLWNDARADEEMRKWWESVEVFVRKTLLQPGFITSTQFTSQSRKLHASGRFFFTQKYKTHTDSMVDVAQAWSRAWLEDPLHVRFSDNWAKLVRDLLFDEKGDLVFKSHLWNDMRTVILPGLVRKIGVIPIPRIEYVDEDLDIAIENLTLQGTNLFPKVIKVKVQHYSELSPFTSGTDKHSSSLALTFGGIQADIRDVAFYFRRKRGLRLRDAGLADVFIGGRGIVVTVKLASTNAGNQEDQMRSVFTVEGVDVKVEELTFTIRESGHDLLYKTFRPLATRLIKKQVAKVFGDGIHSALDYVNEQLVAVREGIATAKKSDDASQRAMLKELWHKQTADVSSSKSSRGSSFRVVPRPESMMLPDHGHKRSWIRRQAGKDVEAMEGEGWRSQAFDTDTKGPKTL